MSKISSLSMTHDLFDYSGVCSFEGKNSCFKYDSLSESRKSSLRRNLFPEKYPSIYHKTKNVITSGFSKINKAYNQFKIKIGSAAQVLRFNSYRKYEKGHCDTIVSAFQTPSRKVRSILGRTPIKLYSPFGIETPVGLK